MIATLLLIACLPLAVNACAAVLSARDGGNGSWAMVRVTACVLMTLALLWVAGSGYWWVPLTALATVLVLHLALFYIGRMLMTGIPRKR